MNTLEIQNDNLPPQETPSNNIDERMDFLNDQKFAGIKEPLSKTIISLSKEHIVSENDFWSNIQQVTENIFSDPLYEFDIEQKTIDAQNIFLFRTEFNKIKTVENNQQTAENNQQTAENIKELRKTLEDKYSNIDDNYKIKLDPASDEFKQLKENTPNINKIPPEKHNLYVSYLYASQQIIAEAKDNKLSKNNYEFVEGFVSLNKELGVESSISLDGWKIDTDSEDGETKTIPTEYTAQDITHNDNLGQELATSNVDVGNFVLDTKSDAIKDKDIIKNRDIDTAISGQLSKRYKDDIAGATQQLLEKNKLTAYTENFDDAGRLINDKEIPNKDKQKLQKISDKVRETFMAKAQDKIIEDTNKVIKSKAVGALLQNIGKYFQIDDSAEAFTIDLTSGIEFSEKELKISGTMEGKKMAFYYDMKSGEIFADDFVHYNRESETFYIDRGQTDSKGREKLPLRMPTLESVLSESKSAYISKVSDAVEHADDIGTYEKQLSKTAFSINKESNVADIVIQHSMAKDIALQETQEFLKKYIPSKTTYSKDKEMREYNLYKIMDTSFDRYTTKEIKIRRDLLYRFEEKISMEKPSFQDKMIKSMFDDKAKKEDTEGNYARETGPNMYQFMHAITHEQPGTIRNEVIDLNLFGNIVSTLESNDSDTSKVENKSKKYIQLETNWETKSDQSSADQLLESEARDTTTTPILTA